MANICKAPETMSAKLRVLKTFNLEKTDRVPIGYDANAGIHQKLAAALGIPDGNRERTLQALGVDDRFVNPPYTGPQLFQELPNRKVDPIDGFYTRWVAHPSGGYWDFCDFPLQSADAETIAAFPVPNPDDFDYDCIAQQLAEYRDYAVHIGDPGMPDVINSTGRIMGMEDTLCNFMLEDEATLAFLNRRMQLRLGVFERILHRYKGKIDFMWLGEDLGTQHAPMISLELFRKILRPIHQQFIDLADAYHLPVIVHTCGSSSWAYEDFIEMGVRAVDTLQPEATNMAPEYLKQHFGGRLAFRGCISTAGPLATGTAAETRAYCKNTLDIMMPGGGYFFAPTHAIQDNSPVENVLAMYQAAHDYGRYL